VGPTRPHDAAARSFRPDRVRSKRNNDSKGVGKTGSRAIKWVIHYSRAGNRSARPEDEDPTFPMRSSTRTSTYGTNVNPHTRDSCRHRAGSGTGRAGRVAGAALPGAHGVHLTPAIRQLHVLRMANDLYDGSGSAKSSVREALAKTGRLFHHKAIMVPLIYSPRYNITAFGLEKLHPFDSRKYGHIHDWLICQGLRHAADFINPNRSPVRTFSAYIPSHT